ncbi:hypothetical protein GCM10022294_11610 [Dietzia aurantiaca]
MQDAQYPRCYSNATTLQRLRVSARRRAFAAIGTPRHSQVRTNLAGELREELVDLGGHGRDGVAGEGQFEGSVLATEDSGQAFEVRVDRVVFVAVDRTGLQV